MSDRFFSPCPQCGDDVPCGNECGFCAGAERSTLVCPHCDSRLWLYWQPILEEAEKDD